MMKQQEVIGGRPRRAVLGYSLVCVLLIGLIPRTAAGQEILGRVLDRNTAQAIADVDLVALRGGTVVARTSSNEQGAFRLVLPAGGEYGIWATRIGYVQQDTARVQIADGQRRMIDLLLDPRPVQLQGIEISDERGAALTRMAPSWGGFLARYRDFAPVGSRRAVRRGDAEMAQSMGMRDVLQWFVPPRPCLYWYVEARFIDVTYNSLEPPDQVALHAFEEIEAVEFYRYPWDAPVVVRPCDDPPNPLTDSRHPSVVMIWLRRSDREPRPDGAK